MDKIIINRIIKIKIKRMRMRMMIMAINKYRIIYKYCIKIVKRIQLIKYIIIILGKWDKMMNKYNKKNNNSNNNNNYKKNSYNNKINSMNKIIIVNICTQIWKDNHNHKT